MKMNRTGIQDFTDFCPRNRKRTCRDISSRWKAILSFALLCRIILRVACHHGWRLGNDSFHIKSGNQFYWVLVRPFLISEAKRCIRSWQLPRREVPGSAQRILERVASFGPCPSADLLFSGWLLGQPQSASGRPVDQITATVRSISIRNLSDRLPVNGNGDELQRLAETCNDMLGRLESAIKSIKQFTADASYELRGPRYRFTRTVAEVSVAAILAQMMIAVRRFRISLMKQLASAAAVLEQMLTLARADAEPFGIALGSHSILLS